MDSPYPDELVGEIAELGSDQERREFFSRRPELDRRELVDFLCDQVTRLLRGDLAVAEEVVATTGWLAYELQDDSARGRFLRASGNVLYAKRDYRGAIAKYEAALELLQKANNSRETIRTLSSGLVLLTHLGEHEKGESWADIARSLCEVVGDPLLRARLEFNTGHAMAHRDRHQEALARYQSAYRYFLEGGETTDIGAALRNIAVTHQQLNDFSAALVAYGEAAEFCKQHGLTRLLLEVEYNLAYVHFLRGDYERSIRLFDETRERCHEMEDWHHKALCDLDQAEIFTELNLTEEAGVLSARAFDRFDGLGMPYEAAQALTYQGMAAARAGAWKNALELLERARAAFGALGNRFWAGTADIVRAQVLHGQGQHTAAAAIASAAHGTFLRIGIPTKIALCELLLARLCLARQDPAGAQRWSESALARSGDLALTLEYQAHLLRGLALESVGDLSAALEAHRNSYEALEELRGHLQADEFKIALSGDQQAVYESLVALTLLFDRSPTGEQITFGYIQKAKSRSLGELLSTRLHDIRPVQQADETLLKEIRELRTRATSFQRQIDQEQRKGEGHSSAKIDQLSKESKATEGKLLRRLRKVQMADPELGALQGFAATDIETLRQSLPAGVQLLEYFIARGIVYVCLIDADRFNIQRLASASAIRTDYAHLQTQLGKLGSGAGMPPKMMDFSLMATKTLLGRLYQALVAPIRDQLTGSHLAIAPHSFLHRLPFHALFDGERHLIDQVPVSYAPSATVLNLCTIRHHQPGEGALVLGVPDERAPLIEEEVRTVAGILPDAKLFLRQEASHDNLVRHGERARIVHVATHGLFRRDNPMFSAIRLGSSNLSLFDLYNLRLRADLVVLSGCSTGLSSVQGSDELVGLTRGVLYAGAKAVLVSLWEVNDRSTNLFMTLFYGFLAEELRPSEALRRAQQSLREEFPHPYHWAPFILVGRISD